MCTRLLMLLLVLIGLVPELVCSCHAFELVSRSQPVDHSTDGHHDEPACPDHPEHCPCHDPVEYLAPSAAPVSTVIDLPGAVLPLDRFTPEVQESCEWVLIVREVRERPRYVVLRTLRI